MAHSRARTTPRKKTSDFVANERLVRVEERLESMEKTHAAGLTSVADRLRELHECVDRIEQRMEAAMHGDKGQLGLIVRIDRLEQTNERSRWLTRAIVGAVVTLAAGALWTALS